MHYVKKTQKNVLLPENSIRTMEIWKRLVGARLERQGKITMGLCARLSLSIVIKAVKPVKGLT